ncbi:MAG: FixH family protein, partial [Hafnia sp.]
PSVPERRFMTTTTQPAASSEKTAAPWWKFGHVWLVLAGPIIVVIAGFTTLWIAVKSPDPVIEEDYYRKGIEINQTLQNPEKSFAPALKSRNHAATPADDQPSMKP